MATRDDETDLANRLFAVATGMLEDATEEAVAGQSPKCRRKDLLRLSARLRHTADQIAAVAKCAGVIAELGRKRR
jgi:hypothetical protein